MTLEAASARLARSSDSVVRVVRDLLWSVSDAAPEGTPLALQHRYEEAVRDALALALELGASTQRTADGAEAVDFRVSRRALIESQRRFLDLTYRFEQDLSWHEGLEELYEIESTGPEGWRAWATGVRDALVGCAKPLYGTRELLFECWQELTEGIGVFATTSWRAEGITDRIASPRPVGAGPVGPDEEDDPDDEA